jgi:hypothetical protein
MNESGASRGLFDASRGTEHAARPAPGCGLSPQEYAILEELRRHVGRESALGVEAVAAFTGISGRVVQTVVKHLIEVHGYPIGSATGKPHGYYWIEDTEDLRRAKAQLAHRIIETAKRLRALDRNALADVMGQMELVLSEER